MARRKSNKKQRLESALITGLAKSNREVVQNHGEAVNIWIEGYTGTPEAKGLRQISAYGAPDLNAPARHAGKAGEVLHKTRVNVERAMKGDPRRVARTDDVGRVNDPVIDIVERDGNGPSAQMKLGQSPENTWKEIVRKGSEKYADAQEILVPADQVQQVKGIFDQRIARAEQRAQAAQARGDAATARRWQKQADDYRQVKAKIKPSTVTYKEAEHAYTRPVFTTGWGILKTVNQAGLKAAKTGAALSAGVSGAQNLGAVVRGEKEIDEALVDTLVDTAKATGVSYATGAAGGLVKSAMEQAAKRVGSRAAAGLLKGMARSNAPALIVTSTIEVGKSLVRYLDGEIDGRQLLGELGEKGVGITTSTYTTGVGATAGAWIGGVVGSVVPLIGNVAGAAAGGFIGGVVGSMVGYIVSTQLYQAAAQLLHQGELDAERRARVIAMCAQAEEAMRREREELDRLIHQYHADRSAELRSYFEGLRDAILINDVDGLTSQLQNITRAFGGALQYQGDEEFEQFMLDGSKSVRVRFT